MTIDSMKETTKSQYFPTTREERCPECYSSCGWCSWYVKEMRKTGCACPPSPASRYTRTRKKCDFAEAQKNTVCKTCDGSGRIKVRVELA